MFTSISGTNEPYAAYISLLEDKGKIFTDSEFLVKEMELKDMDDESIIEFGANNGASASVSQVFLIK